MIIHGQLSSSNLQKMFLNPRQGFAPVTFWLPVRSSNYWATQMETGGLDSLTINGYWASQQQRLKLLTMASNRLSQKYFLRIWAWRWRSPMYHLSTPGSWIITTMYRYTDINKLELFYLKNLQILNSKKVLKHAFWLWMLLTYPDPIVLSLRNG